MNGTGDDLLRPLHCMLWTFNLQFHLNAMTVSRKRVQELYYSNLRNLGY